jgi:signal peptidase II
MKRPSSLFWLIPASALVLIDEWLKYFFLERLLDEGSLLDPGVIDFAIHKNFGIAFDIPFRLEFTVIFSVIIGYFLLRIAYKNLKRNPDLSLACAVIITGALGNLFDRLYYGFTVDYIILLGRSAINISDVLIVLGAIMLLLSSRRKKHRKKLSPDEY